MDIASEFRIVLRSDEMMSVYVEEISLQELNGKLIIQIPPEVMLTFMIISPIRLGF